ncbi:hypothetical protein QVD17_41936 [Tagetes erecta]|uniref:RRM domain-containing protein n=1 Tax=Tagetes erecta TaxID=13708 RepID=A0AAD8NFY2_TARER|nr:hypothetical protein QVD17_41936 [Tagetes erecta]
MACSSPLVNGGLTLRTNRISRSSTSSFFLLNLQPQYVALSITSSKHTNRLQLFACSSSHPQKTATNFTSSPKLFVSGLSFRTSEESLRNAFQSFGQLIEVNLVMDKIANRPRGFAFLRYATKDESEKAIEGMHGKFLDGRVIFVEYAKPRSQLHQGVKQDSKPNR